MVDTVHARGHQHPIQHTFKRNWQSYIAVMKQGVGLERQFVDDVRPAARTNDCSMYDAQHCGACHPAEMEPDRRRNIQIWIEVMHVVETPQNRKAMVGAMP